MTVPETLRLYTSRSSIRIEPIYNDGRRVPKMIELDRSSYAVKAVEAAVLSDSSVSVVHGIVGIVRLLAGPYLIVITQRKRVAVVAGCEIWRLMGVELIQFAATQYLNSEQKADEVRYQEMLTSQLNSGAFYFAYNYDLTHTAQRIAMFPPEARMKPMWERADQRFMWNFGLCKDLIRAGHVDEFILPLVQGFVESRLCSIYYRKFELTLITRRSCNRSGTRFNQRGIDWGGNVANFCEIEQLLQCDGHLASFVQIRGSIPVFWTQQVNIKYHPPIEVLSEDHFSAFARHFQSLLQTYGPITILNLVDSKGPDLLLSNTYRQQVMLFGSEHIRYVFFDFHKECSKMRWHRLSLLMDDIAADHKRQGYFVQNSTGQVLGHQVGVFRANCMDCLDRTNVVQSMIAKATLRHQLNDLGILPLGDSIDNIPEITAIFRNMWADHADAISMVYAGTGALKTDFTRTGQRTLAGMLQDGYNSVIRYYLNNFKDGYRQDAIDLVLNRYQVSPHVPSPFTPSLVQQRLRLIPLACLVLTALGLLLLIMPFGDLWDRAYYSTLFFLVGFVLYRVTLHLGPQIVDKPRLAENSAIPAELKKLY